MHTKMQRISHAQCQCKRLLSEIHLVQPHYCSLSYFWFLLCCYSNCCFQFQLYLSSINLGILHCLFFIFEMWILFLGWTWWWSLFQFQHWPDHPNDHGMQWQTFFSCIRTGTSHSPHAHILFSRTSTFFYIVPIHPSIIWIIWIIVTMLFKYMIHASHECSEVWLSDDLDLIRPDA